LQTALQNTKSIRNLQNKQSRLARQLSTSYMALSQSSDVYQQGLEAGYDKRAAGLTALLAMASQYYLMSRDNSLGDWFLDKSVGYTKNNINKAIVKALEPQIKIF
jgi:hypothetical protein